MALEKKEWVGAELAGRYRITSELGAGGMALVYLAQDRRDNRQVVIKVPRQAMLEDPEFIARFTREAKSLIRLVHPHIVKIRDVGEHEGRPYLVMDYLPGGSLRAQLEGDRRHVANLQAWLPGIAAALDFCHQNNCVHRDVKPDNILFDGHGKPFLSDFGIAKVMSNAPASKMTVMTSAGMVLGTAQYMAPELVMGHKYDGKADQYSLAVTVYEALSAQLPFSGNTPMAIFVEQSTKEVPPLKSLTAVSHHVSECVQRSLAKDPGARFPDCMSFARALLNDSADPPANVTPPVAGQKAFASADPMQVTCPGCRKQFKIPMGNSGKRLRCPVCKTRIADPAQATPVTSVQGAVDSSTNRQKTAVAQTQSSSKGATQIGAGTSLERSSFGQGIRRLSAGAIVACVVALGLMFIVIASAASWVISPKRPTPVSGPVVVKTSSPETGASKSNFLAKQIEDERKKNKELADKLAAQDAEREKALLDAKKAKELLAAQEAEREAALRAKSFSTDEFDAWKVKLTNSTDRMGRMIHNATHPTGKYEFTGQPLVNRAAEGSAISVALTIYWKGGILATDYETTHSFSFSKNQGVTRLSVTKDTAVFQIAPANLQSAESQIRDLIESLR